jgi:hypothetical protein
VTVKKVVVKHGERMVLVGTSAILAMVKDISLPQTHPNLLVNQRNARNAPNVSLVRNVSVHSVSHAHNEPQIGWKRSAKRLAAPTWCSTKTIGNISQTSVLPVRKNTKIAVVDMTATRCCRAVAAVPLT